MMKKYKKTAAVFCVLMLLAAGAAAGLMLQHNQEKENLAGAVPINEFRDIQSAEASGLASGRNILSRLDTAKKPRILSSLLGYILRLCFLAAPDLGWAIILFTLIVKVILFPISLISQKNSIIMVKMTPQLDDIKSRYAGEFETMLKEQKALYKKEKYSTLKALLPLLIQIPIILGVIGVIYSPLSCILRLDSSEISEMTIITEKYLNKEELGSGADLQVVNLVHARPELFSSVDRTALEAVVSFKTEFFGLDLSAVPSAASISILIPLLSALSAFIMCFVQNLLNPLTREQGFFTKWGISILLIAFSGYFSLVCPAGVGLYWAAGNLFGILVSYVCYLIYNPNKYIDYKNRPAVKAGPEEKREMREEKAREKEKKALSKIREKEDKKRFYSAQKELVFYSESSGFYKYFKGFIEYILAHSDIVVHYVTSDMDDQVCKIGHERFQVYYCSPNGLITLMMKMESDIVVLTLPDLEKYQIKRSLVREDIEYIYTDHGIGSYHLMYREGALDHFDTIFCNTKTNAEEVRATERVYGLKEKKLVCSGFPLLDEILADYAKLPRAEASSRKPQVLIAPSWQKDNILEFCLDELMDALAGTDYRIIIRPHPEFVRRFPAKMKAIIDRYGSGHEVQADFSSNSTVYTSDIVITDWSTIAQEFSLASKKPSLFINTPMKILNPEWEKIGVNPMEIWIREKIGKSVNPEDLSGIDGVISDLFQNTDRFQAAIEDFIANDMYNVGSAAEIGGEYIISRLRGAKEDADGNAAEMTAESDKSPL